MTRGELRRFWRARVRDTRPKSYLWSDELFDLYLDEAHVEAARRAHLLVDSTSDLTRADIAAGDIQVALDRRIIFVRRARLESTGRGLRWTPLRMLDTGVPGWESATASVPIRYVPDWQSGALAVWPPSSVDDGLLMTVVREPLRGLESDDESPEIAPRYHRPLLDWVSYRAYSEDDADTSDSAAAGRALAAFEKEFGPNDGAINEAYSLANYAPDEGAFQ